MLKYLPELLRENIISQETADQITAYYLHRKQFRPNKIYLIFGILGSILVGLGIISILAHNWDFFDKTTKLVIAFVPLLLGQAICAFTLLKKHESNIWRESSASFTFLAFGACISLICLVYHSSLTSENIILLWMIMCFPISWVMKSSISSLFYITGITVYAIENGYGIFHYSETYYYWILLALAFPYYLTLLRKNPNSHMIILHHIFMALSVIIALGSLSRGNTRIMHLAYMSLFALLIHIGNVPYFSKKNISVTLINMLGYMGSLIILYQLSFDWFWINPKRYATYPSISPEYISLTILTLLAALLLLFKYRRSGIKSFGFIDFTFISVILVYMLGCSYPHLGMWLINILIFISGITIILKGLKTDHLGILNLGLLIIAILAVCRYFDTEISFLVKGILFVSVGAGFFVTNSIILKSRKKNEN